MEKMSGKSLDLLEKNIDIIQKTFPEVMTEEEFNGKVERKIDFDKLRLLLGDEVSDKEERYELRWNGKNDAIRFAQTPSNGTLRPDKESSKNWNDTENLYIEGDNLEVLKLLEKSYFGEIKMIYIDPPYNTGSDFVYKDDFRDNIKNYLEKTCQNTTANVEGDGRYHTNWLNMIYPRLKLAKNLLSKDGIIFISIDDNEICNLKKVCDEIFGDKNFISIFTWIKKKKGSHLSKTVRSMTEYVLAYSKDIESIELFGEKAYSDKWQPLVKRTNAQKTLKFAANTLETKLQNGIYEKGNYGEGSTSITFNNDFKVLDNKIIDELDVTGPFVWTQNKLDEEIKLGTKVALSIKFGFNALRSDQSEKVKRPTTILDNKLSIGTNEDAYDEGKKIFGKENIMSYPKPTSLIKYLINTLGYYEKEMLVLDFFSGSATTAHAVMQLNAEDGGNRKFIMVQLPEITPEKSEARKAGYENICEIGKERIRRAGDMIVNENKDKEGIEDLDIGFKVFKLDSSNIKEWNPEYENIDYALYERVDVVKMGRTNEDLLYEIIIKMGVEPTVYIEEIKVGDKIIYNIGMGILLICLEDEITDEIIDEILNRKSIISSIDKDIKTKVVFKESGFIRDSDKINAIQKLKQFGITEVRSV